jgi:DNA replication protein DnaC
VPIGQWYDFLGDPTHADAICDRVLHNAHNLVLKGPSRRKEALRPEGEVAPEGNDQAE